MKRARQARTPEARQAREAAIRAAALQVFVDKGFAEARLDEIAARAGVAKGTIYLYFESKEALLQDLVRSAVAGPIADFQEKLRQSELSTEESLRLLSRWFANGLLADERRKIIGLVLAEGRNFPALAEFYHSEVISRGLALMRMLIARGHARGDFFAPELERFPHLIVAPALVTVIWDLLFARVAPLDGAAMLEAHLNILMRAARGEGR